MSQPNRSGQASQSRPIPAVGTGEDPPTTADAPSTVSTVALPPDLLGAWDQLWTNRRQPYAAQQEDGTYRWVYAPCDTAVLAAHLVGTQTVALSCTDTAGGCRWLCLDADQADALLQLLALAAALTTRGLPGLVEASRRGGHLWLLLDTPTPVVSVRRVLLQTLDELRASGVPVPATYELYPDAGAEGAGVGAIGHAVRLPLGIHRLTGRRYVLFNEYGYPCAFSSTDAAVRFVLAWPRVASAELERRAQLRDDHELRPVDPVGPVGRDWEQGGTTTVSGRVRGRVGTHSLVIRWVDAAISPLDLLADLTPETELRHVGRGYLGWCPFHDDRAPDEAGRSGTPSFYVVLDRRYGWSWRCLSTNCPQSWGPMRHTFELFQRLLGLTVRSAIVEACQRWPEADVRAAMAPAETASAEMPSEERMG